MKDGLIEDPTKCKFDPKVLLCKNGDGPSCLTAPQAEAAKKIYAAATNPRTGQELFPSLSPGSELNWGIQAAGPDPSANIYDHFKYVVFKNPAWDWKTFDFDKGVALAEQPENAVMNAPIPTSSRSRAQRKLLMSGWADSNVSPLNTIKYYKTVVDTLGGASKTSNNVRLFMEPGMGHCGGGEGPNVFDKVGSLDQWVEQGKAPEKIIASHSAEGKVDRTRPLCPYPQVAKYKGSVASTGAANFACQVPDIHSRMTDGFRDVWLRVSAGTLNRAVSGMSFPRPAGCRPKLFRPAARLAAGNGQAETRTAYWRVVEASACVKAGFPVAAPAEYKFLYPSP